MLRRIRGIWLLAKGVRLRYAAAVAALVAASGFLYLVPLVPQVTIDGVLAAEADAPPSPFTAAVVEALGGAPFLARRLWIPAVIVALLTALAGVFTYWRGRWSAGASETIVRRVRDRVYDHLQRLPVSHFDKAETGDLVQRCTSDVETLRLFLATHVVEVGRALIMLLVPVPFMLAIDVRMTVSSLVLIPFIVAFGAFSFGRIRAAFEKADEAEAAMTTTLHENITGIRVVRAFARQEFECAKFAEKNHEHRELDKRVYHLLARYWSISDFLCMAQKAIVLGVGAWLLARGELRVGAYFYFLSAAVMFIWPMRMMGRILGDLGKAVVALGRLEEILETPAEIAPEAPETLPDVRGEIVFDRVSFSHAAGAPVLRALSFRVDPGETLALLGPSGSGKSTIVNLLLRFYDPDEGTIRLDGCDFARLDRSFVRSRLAVVMQEPFLYSKSLRENIRIARSAVGDDEVAETASVACVHDAILEFEQGYDTLIGERGVTLSGGQRQRVALARALIQDPAVLLLDDALSAVDTETETMIIEALRRRRGRHTTIVIAHRLSTLMYADRIIVLERGRVAQTGTHRALLEEGGLYRRLWEIQSAEGATAGIGARS